MNVAHEVLRERVDEIHNYIELLERLDNANKAGSSQVTPVQYHILIANAFVLMYNMVEATIVQSIKSLEVIISSNNDCPRYLSQKLKEEWISNFLGTKEPLAHEKRLKKGLDFYNHITSEASTVISITKGGGGNWDDEEIYRLTNRLGININLVPRLINANVKRKLYDDMGCMKFIVQKRNKLAHGEISFSECGRDEDIYKIKKIFDDTSKYLHAVVALFETFSSEKYFIDEH